MSLLSRLGLAPSHRARAPPQLAAPGPQARARHARPDAPRGAGARRAPGRAVGARAPRLPQRLHLRRLRRAGRRVAQRGRDRPVRLLDPPARSGDRAAARLRRDGRAAHLPREPQRAQRHAGPPRLARRAPRLGVRQLRVVAARHRGGRRRPRARRLVALPGAPRGAAHQPVGSAVAHPAPLRRRPPHRLGARAPARRPDPVGGVARVARDPGPRRAERAQGQRPDADAGRAQPRPARALRGRDRARRGAGRRRGAAGGAARARHRVPRARRHRPHRHDVPARGARGPTTSTKPRPRPTAAPPASSR